MTFVHATTRTARAPRYCDSCDGYTIRTGDRYRALAAAPGGELGYIGWSRMNECAKCAERYGRTVEPAAVETKRCHQCGRTGTREFVPYPDRDVDLPDGSIILRAGELQECANKTACRKRWPKTREEDDC